MNKPENSTIINVCVIPSEEVSREYIAISQSLKNDKTMFVLGDGKFAHMTAFMARFSNDVLPQVLQGVEKALGGVKAFNCEHVGYFMTEGRYLETSYRRSDDFMALHEALIANLAEHRINPGQPYEEGYFTPYTIEQRSNAEETGYDLARNLYRPHVTLTRYVESGVPSEFPGFPPASLSFNLNRICVYKADDNGAVYELIKEYFVDKI